MCIVSIEPTCHNNPYYLRSSRYKYSLVIEGTLSRSELISRIYEFFSFASLEHTRHQQDHAIIGEPKGGPDRPGI